MNSLEIKEFREKYNLTQQQLAEIVVTSIRAVQSWEQGQRNITQSAIKLLDGFENRLANNNNVETINKGVAYYDIDFTSSFLEVTNNQNVTPDAYIDHPFFKGCDFVVRNSGQSMAKVICHGDAIGLVEVKNWREFFPFGEIYAIVTNDNLRMIKVISKGDTDEFYTLISKPTDNKKDEFPPQQIKKNSILSIFRVQASSHLF